MKKNNQLKIQRLPYVDLLNFVERVGKPRLGLLNRSLIPVILGMFVDQVT